MIGRDVQMHAVTETTSVLQSSTSRDTTALRCLVIVASHHGIHLTVPQLIQRNVLPNRELLPNEIVRCAISVGLKAKVLHLDWRELSHLKRVLPAIVELRNG